MHCAVRDEKMFFLCSRISVWSHRRYKALVWTECAAGALMCVNRGEQQVLRFDLLTSSDLLKHSACRIHTHTHTRIQTLGEDAMHDSLLD